MTVRDLVGTAQGAAALEAATGAAGLPPITAAEALRRAGFAPALAAAALTQVELRRTAARKFGADAARMFFTRAGLEQATRAEVARRRAERLAAAGIRRITDLGCGVGADSIAFARAGMRVTAVEADPETAEIARANVIALSLTDRVQVHCADATQWDLTDTDAAFCDPARRSGARRRFDPALFSPPWSFVLSLAQSVPQTVVKLAPGLDHGLIPPGAEAEWVSVDGAVVEAALWIGPLAQVPRRASLLREGRWCELVGSGDAAAPTGHVGSIVYEPDGAVVRAHLVAEFAASVRGWLADPHIAYVFASSPVPTAYGQGFAVREELPFATKRLRAALREREIGQLEILKRGVAVQPEQLRRELRLSGPAAATLLLARIGDAHIALLCQRLPAGQ